MIFCVLRWTWSFVFIFVFVFVLVSIYVPCFCAATDFSANKDLYNLPKHANSSEKFTSVRPVHTPRFIHTSRPTPRLVRCNHTFRILTCGPRNSSRIYAAVHGPSTKPRRDQRYSDDGERLWWFHAGGRGVGTDPPDRGQAPNLAALLTLYTVINCFSAKLANLMPSDIRL